MEQNEALHLCVYQIYPKSFCDANGDGIGDLPGVLSKLDYLQALGVNALWLCPICLSPGDDGGYDVADFRAIDPQFGTMEDFRRLLSELHARGMKLIMDFVPNHASTSHAWFQASRQSKEGPYADYFYWFDEIPNGWGSCFGGSAYEYEAKRGQYYLHSYCVSQADLNYENPAVREEMKAIVRYYADMGVDGFRIDVVDQIAKDWEGGRNCFGPHLHEFIHELFYQKGYERLFTVGECWASSIEEAERHCAPRREELTTLFQFDHLECGRSSKWERSAPQWRKYRDVLAKWQNAMQAHGLIPTLFTDNHDNAYLLSRMESEGKRYEAATLLAGMTYLLRGVPFLYQGTEWGCESSRFASLEGFADVEALHKYEELAPKLGEEKALEEVNFGARDNARRPLAWNKEAGHGFTSGRPWMPFASNAEEINEESDRGAERSIGAFYRALLRLRASEEAFLTGGFLDVSGDDPLFAYVRENAEKKFMVLCNFEEETPLPAYPDLRGIALSNMGRKELPNALAPFEVLVLELSK